MQENVGRRDQIGRWVVGSALVALGYGRWGGSRGALGGLASMVGGALVLESAITRVCPINALLGLDTRGADLVEEDVQRALETASERFAVLDEDSEPAVWQESLPYRP